MKDNLLFQKFVMAISDLIGTQFGGVHKIKVECITKNNGVKMHGIMRTDQRQSAVIYLEPFFAKYEMQLKQDFEHQVKVVAKEMVEIFKRKELDYDIVQSNVYCDLEFMKNNVTYRIINGKWNEETLKIRPYIPFMDMVIVFQLYLGVTENSVVSTEVRNNHIKNLGISVEELYEYAKNNTERLMPLSIEKLSNSLISNFFDEEDKKDGGVKEFSMYVITNEYGVNGAAAVMYKGALANLAEHLDSNLLIFPSSTHEVLLIPFGNKSEVTSDAEWIVRAVNRSDVHEIERLSDRAYFYDKDKCELSFALPREGEEQIVIQL